MQKAIIDCDPGHDDALAILLAAKHLDLLGITTVAGNQSLAKVVTNALKIVEFAGLTHIPVIVGADRPLFKDAIHAANIHGETGLDGPTLPEPTTSLHPGHAVDFIIDTVMRTDNVMLIPTGPLTNIATALRRQPEIAPRIAEISLMGGGLTHGNTTATAEFNIYVDPEAAHVVFTSGIPIKMCGLNLTRQANATGVETARIRELGNRTGVIVADLLDFFRSTIKEVFGIDGGALHDPCAVAALIDPTLIHFEPMHVAVELHGKHTYGMKDANAEVALSLDTPRFFDLLTETIALYP